MSSPEGRQVTEYLETYFTPFNDVSESTATSSADCNYEDYDEFVQSIDTELFESNYNPVFREIKKATYSMMVSNSKDALREIFSQSNVDLNKFNLLVFYLLENAKKSASTEEEVEKGYLVACCWLGLCSLPGANSKFFQQGLYEKIMKIIKNCCYTLKIGDVRAPTKKKKATKKGNDETSAEGEVEGEQKETEVALGPPKISVDIAEKYLNDLTTHLYGFMKSDSVCLDDSCLSATLETVEEIGRIDLDTKSASNSSRSNSIQDFKSIDKYIDRYSSLLHVMVEGKYLTRRMKVYSRIVRPRLSMMHFPDESNKSSKIPTERKRAGDLIAAFCIARIERKPVKEEMELIQKVLAMVYYLCPDLQEFRTNTVNFLFKILSVAPYEYVYDFVQKMFTFSKCKQAGVKSISTELASTLAFGYDFTAPDPGPILEDDEEEEKDKNEKQAKEDGSDAEDTGREESEDDKEDEEDEDDDDEEEERLKKKKKDKKVPKKKEAVKPTTNSTPSRKNAMDILYSIIYTSCLDKSAAQRLHGANNLAKILESETHRVAFEECCKKLNVNYDERFGDVNENLNDTIDNANTTAAQVSKNKKKDDLLLEEQQIIQKFNKLKMLNKGEARVENDVIFMLLRRLAVDEKAPVKKSSCHGIRHYLSYCQEKEKFDVIIGILQKLCRDKLPTIRKISSDTLTELMLQENTLFKNELSDKWLNSLILLLDDNEADIQEHARKLIMKVISPLLDRPNDLTWALLETIETTKMHRQVFMTTLKDASRDGLVKQNVMETMKKLIMEGDVNKTSAWMVLSQLAVFFHKHVDFAIDTYYALDITNENKIVKYVIHTIVNNIKYIDRSTMDELLSSMKDSITNCTIHSSHVKDIFHCVGKLMNGIGDGATPESARKFISFCEEFLSTCVDTIVSSFDMFKRRDEWNRNSASYERVVIVALNITSEVFLFVPTLVPRYDRLGKTLSMIVNSSDQHLDTTHINPDVPSVNYTRPPTAMSEIGSSQRTAAGALLPQEYNSAILFSDKVRAVAVITLSNMILAHDKMLKLMPMLTKQLQTNPSHEIRSNIVIALGDICETFKTDRFAPILAGALCDPSVIVRRHAINEIARLIASNIFRFADEIMIRMMLTTLDANEDVRNDVKLYISEVLQHEMSNFFPIHFVHYMVAMTQARRVAFAPHDEDDKGNIDISIGGGEPLARSSRIAIYNFMIESLDDRSRFDVKRNICLRIFNPIINGEYDFGEHTTQCLLDDALLIMASNEMQVKMEVGKNPNDNNIEEPSPEAMNAASDFLRTVYLQNYMDTILPSILSLREFLYQNRSPLQRKCQLAIRMICLEHKNDLDVILKDNRQLKDEMVFELKRVKQRAEEANRILDDHLRKVTEFQKQQRRLSQFQQNMEVDEQVAEDVEMGSPVAATNSNRSAPCTPRNEIIMSTPKTARNASGAVGTPMSSNRRLLSPKTIKRIRKSVGMLISENQNAMKPPAFDETCLSPAPNIVRPVVEKAPTVENEQEEEKTIVEEKEGNEVKEVVEKEQEKVDEEVRNTESEERNGNGVFATECQKTADAIEEQVEKENNPETTKRSRRKRTPTPECDESIDKDGKTWKKPKVVNKSPEQEHNMSMNVTIRRSRRNSEETREKTKKQKLDENSEAAQIRNRGVNPIFDTTVLGEGRHCSTPISGRDRIPNLDVTFNLDLSVIGNTKEAEKTERRKTLANRMEEIAEGEEE